MFEDTVSVSIRNPGDTTLKWQGKNEHTEVSPILYTNNRHAGKKKTEKQFHSQFTPRNKWIKPESLGVTKEVKYLYSKNLKTLQRN